MATTYSLIFENRSVAQGAGCLYQQLDGEAFPGAYPLACTQTPLAADEEEE